MSLTDKKDNTRGRGSVGRLEGSGQTGFQGETETLGCRDGWGVCVCVGVLLYPGHCQAKGRLVDLSCLVLVTPSVN